MMDLHGPKHVEEVLWNKNYGKSTFSSFFIVTGNECFDWLTNCQFTKNDFAAWKLDIIKLSI